MENGIQASSHPIFGVAVQDYIKYVQRSLVEAIAEKEKEHAFWAITKNRKLQQLSFLNGVIGEFDVLEKMCVQTKDLQSAEKTLLPALDQLFLSMISHISSPHVDIDSWYEIIELLKKFVRIFMTNLVAFYTTIFSAYLQKWSVICQQCDLPIPYVQLNIIGLSESVSNKRFDLAEQYLEHLNMINWTDDFDIVFSKKSIRDRLYYIATLLIEQAGSVGQLNQYVQVTFKSNLSIGYLLTLYQQYLKGIQRKLDLFRITYPEFSHDSANAPHPVREDVSVAQQRCDMINGFISALHSSLI